jgi:hypothetical protein
MSAFGFALLVLLALHIYSRYIEPKLILVKRVKIDTGGKINDGKPP